MDEQKLHDIEVLCDEYRNEGSLAVADMIVTQTPKLIAEVRRLQDSLNASAGIANQSEAMRYELNQERKELLKALKKIAKQEMPGPSETPREEYMYEQYKTLVAFAQRALDQVKGAVEGENKV